jgi:hypothetical protein
MVEPLTPTAQVPGDDGQQSLLSFAQRPSRRVERVISGRTSLYGFERIFDLEDMTVGAEDCLLVSFSVFLNMEEVQTHQTKLCHIQTPSCSQFKRVERMAEQRNCRGMRRVGQEMLSGS